MNVKYLTRILNLKLIITVMILSALISSCKKDEVKPVIYDSELSADIQKLVPEELMKEIVNLGMPINKGKTPPDLTGIFKVTPFVLKNSDIASDYIGKKFSDYKFKLYGQDSKTLQIKLDYINDPEKGTGLGAFIAGSDSTFTVFAEIEAESKGTKAKIVNIISGKVKNNGIRDLYFANFMLDNFGDAADYWIENGEGRVIYDSNGFSERITDINLRTIQENSNLRMTDLLKSSGLK